MTDQPTNLDLHVISAEHARPDHVIAGVDLRGLIDGPAPFTTVYVNGGPSIVERAHVLLDRAGVPDLHRFLDVLSDDLSVSQVLAAGGHGGVAQFTIEEPLRFDVVRSGSASSFGTLLEHHQFSAPHAVVTVEDDVFGLTSFGSVAVPDADHGPVAINESVVHTIDQLRFIEPKLLALVGTRAEIDDVAPLFNDAFPHCWIQHYPTADMDTDLMTISDQIVRDAQTRAAETLTHDLAQFRAARDAGLTVEGDEVLSCLRDGRAASVLVHDDPTDGRLSGEDRLIDAVVHAAILEGVRTIMIPAIPAQQGPVDGLGVILRGDVPGIGSVQTHPDVELDANVERDVPVLDDRVTGMRPSVA